MSLQCGEARGEGATLRRDELHDGERLGHDGGQQLQSELHDGAQRLHVELNDGEQQLHDGLRGEAPQHEPGLHEPRDWP